MEFFKPILSRKNQKICEKKKMDPILFKHLVASPIEPSIWKRHPLLAVFGTILEHYVFDRQIIKLISKIDYVAMNRLPKEITEKIIQYLDLRDLLLIGL